MVEEEAGEKQRQAEEAERVRKEKDLAAQKKKEEVWGKMVTDFMAEVQSHVSSSTADDDDDNDEMGDNE